MRMIDADELLTAFPVDDEPTLTKSCVRMTIQHMPTVDVVHVVHGRWKAVTKDMVTYKRVCSCCGEEAPFDESEDVYLLYPHCPWCGASLDIKGGNGNG